MPYQTIENFDPTKIPAPEDSVNFHVNAYYVFAHLAGVVIPGFNAGLAWTENLLANFSEVITVDGTDPDNVLVTTGLDLPDLVEGLVFDLLIPSTNTGPSTAAIDGHPPINIVTVTGAPTPAGYLTAGEYVIGRIDSNGDLRVRWEKPRTGSGPGGDFTRYDHGEQVCATTINAGSTWTYEKPFASVPHIDPEQTTVSGAPRVISTRNKTTTFVDIDGWTLGGGSATPATSVEARGPWY